MYILCLHVTQGIRPSKSDEVSVNHRGTQGVVTEYAFWLLSISRKHRTSAAERKNITKTLCPKLPINLLSVAKRKGHAERR